MKAFVALAALLAAAPSSPPIVTGPNTPYFAGMPPAKYDGTGVAIVVFTDDVSQYCGPAVAGLTIIACVRHTKDRTPFIFMPNPRYAAEAGDPYAQVLHHEVAHVRGWAYDHPMENP